MKYIYRLFFVIIILLFSVSACIQINSDDDDCKQGNGVMQKDLRAISGFDKVVLEGHADIYLEQGSEESVEIELDDNLLQYISTEVKGSTLIISTEEDLCYEKMTVWLRMIDVRGMEIEGAADLKANTKITTDKLVLNIEGAGDIDIPTVEADSIEALISGAGDMTVSGKARDINMEINGTGNLDFLGTQAETVRIVINGSGEARMTVSKELDVIINGAGTVQYRGDTTTVRTSINGAGSVQKLD